MTSGPPRPPQRSKPRILPSESTPKFQIIRPEKIPDILMQTREELSDQDDRLDRHSTRIKIVETDLENESKRTDKLSADFHAHQLAIQKDIADLTQKIAVESAKIRASLGLAAFFIPVLIAIITLILRAWK